MWQYTDAQAKTQSAKGNGGLVRQHDVGRLINQTDEQVRLHQANGFRSAFGEAIDWVTKPFNCFDGGSIQDA